MNKMDREDKVLAAKLVRLVLVGVICATLIAFLGGCSSLPRVTHDQCNATKFPTAHEHEQCLLAASAYEQQQHEKEDKRLVRRDKLIIFLNACDRHPSLGLLEKRHIGRSSLPTNREQAKARKEHGYAFTHDNVSRRARMHDFICTNPREIIRQIERQRR